MKYTQMVSKLKFLLSVVLIMWFVFIFNWIFNLNFNSYGIVPRTPKGLIGIFTSPFLHLNFQHIISNTVPFVILMGTLSFFYEKLNLIVLIGGVLVWVFGRSSSHIGASGLIYGLATFLIAIGFYRKSFKTIMISIIVIGMYGSLIFGVLPTNSYISWEGHLFGALAGIFVARLYKNKNTSIEIN
jgi:membrane associated rhomboid family serine protease